MNQFYIENSINTFLFFTLLLFVSVEARAQDSISQLNALYIDDILVIDGVLDEACWTQADSTNYFYQYDPFQTQKYCEFRIDCIDPIWFWSLHYASLQLRCSGFLSFAILNNF